MSHKEIEDKELKAVLQKEGKNPIFANEHIVELHALFSLYADPRQRRTDIRDFLLTASTLGLDQKYQLVFRVLQEIQDASNGHAMNFEEFLKELTNKIVSLLIFRATHSTRTAERTTSHCWIYKIRASSISTIYATSTSSSDTATPTSNSSMSSIQLEDTELKPSPGTNSINSLDEKSRERNSVCDINDRIAMCIKYHVLSWFSQNFCCFFTIFRIISLFEQNES